MVHGTMLWFAYCEQSNEVAGQTFIHGYGCSHECGLDVINQRHLIAALLHVGCQGMAADKRRVSLHEMPFPEAIITGADGDCHSACCDDMPTMTHDLQSTMIS